MEMNRRAVMRLGAAASAAALLPGAGRAGFAPKPDGWRRFEITTRVELPATGRGAQVWIPIPAISEAGWMEPGETRWTTSADTAGLGADPASGAMFLHAVWGEGGGAQVIELTSTVSAQSRHADLSQPRDVAPLPEAERARYTAPTALIPTDGIVKRTSEEITAGAEGDLQKARRIYDWIVKNTARNPETRGCGLGDVASMLEMGDLTGKCADLNALYVGLARAAGLAARDVYGLRVAPSQFGYKSLGAETPDVTKAQHCRAEVFLDGHGWIAVDPADVRKVMLEESPGGLPLGHPKVVDARETLFGAWEGNWIGYNFAHDVVLPGAEAGPVEFLMYPQAEIDGIRRDPLAPGDFAYAITAREVV